VTSTRGAGGCSGTLVAGHGLEARFGAGVDEERQHIRRNGADHPNTVMTEILKRLPATMASVSDGAWV